MDIDYLYSVFDLYLKKEKNDRKVFLNIKKSDDIIEFSFNMKNDDIDKTKCTISYDEFNSHQNEILRKYKDNLMTIDEKYDYNNINNTCYYYVLFSSGRSISFNGFSILEMNNIRNILYDIKINQDEVRLEELSKEKQMAYHPRLRLEQAGFSSVTSIFLLAIFLIDIFVIAIWIVKTLAK